MYLKVINVYRGLAALAVCLFHFVAKTPGVLDPDGFWKEVFTVGHYGVQVFFIISGFIIMYSLDAAKYKTNQYFRFIVRRLIRLEPPYLFSLVGVIGYLILREYLDTFNGVSYIPDVNQALLHLGYLIPYQETYDWISPVYWTLGIEFQFYLIMGLIFVVLMRYKKIALALMLMLMLFNTDVDQYYIVDHLNYFFCGMILFLAFKERNNLFLGGAILSLALLYHTPVPAIVFGTMILTLLKYPSYSNKVFDFLANISYSLYLAHPFIGQPIINWGIKRVQGDFQVFMLISISLIITLLFSYLMYIWVEKPSKRWSKRVRLS